MLESVEITNFKNIRHQKIELERLTVFVGANASGKTSVLEAIDIGVSACKLRGNWNLHFQAQRHCDWLYTRDGDGDLSISCTTNRGQFTVLAVPPSDLAQKDPRSLGTNLWGFTTEPSDLGIINDALNAVGSPRYLKFNVSNLSSASYTDVVPPQVSQEGDGLASTLAFMALNDPDSFNSVSAEMCRLVTNLRRIRFTKSTLRRSHIELAYIDSERIERQVSREYQGEAILFDFKNAPNVPAHAASEGTLILLGLLTVLLGPGHPDILLLDDIEHGLHPLAQKTLLEILAGIMDRFPKLQILATAHSPYLLDCLKPEQVRLMAIDPDGYAVCGRLVDHPQFEKWKDEMAPGELWSLFGEKWVTEGVLAH